MTKCVVVATFRPKPEHLVETRELFLEVAKEVRLEQGCIYYDLYEDVSGKLVFIEAWESRQLWQMHSHAPTVTRILDFIDGKLTEPALIQEMYAAQ